jgi:hypothetical protein
MTTKQQLTWLFAVLVVIGVAVGAYLWWVYPRLTEKARTFKFVRSAGSGAGDNTQDNLLSVDGQSLAVELVDYRQ